ncbi:MAG: hypothetical protein R2941_23850 [Desulfobacterales bacterium]
MGIKQTDSAEFKRTPEFINKWRIINEEVEEIISSGLQDLAAGLSLEESIQICEKEIRLKQEEFVFANNISHYHLEKEFASQLEHARERIKGWDG